MKKALLASTALVGAALLSAPALAGTVGSGDNLEVRLSGFMWFQAHALDEDVARHVALCVGFVLLVVDVEVKACQGLAPLGLERGNARHSERRDAERPERMAVTLTLYQR